MDPNQDASLTPVVSNLKETTVDEGRIHRLSATIAYGQQKFEIMFDLNAARLPQPELYSWYIWSGDYTIFSQSSSGGSSRHPDEFPAAWRGRLLSDYLTACLQAVRIYCDNPATANEQAMAAVGARLFQQHAIWPYQYSRLGWRGCSWQHPWPLGWMYELEKVDFLTYIEKALPYHFATPY